MGNQYLHRPLEDEFNRGFVSGALKVVEIVLNSMQDAEKVYEKKEGMKGMDDLLEKITNTKRVQ